MSSKKQEEEGEAGSGGKSGDIEFRYKDPFAVQTRDDLLSPEEKKRLAIVHKDIHKARVDKQKSTREERKALKEGKLVSTYEKQLKQGLSGSGGQSRYKQHPISLKAQFSGIDKQVVGVPTLNEADTNSELKEKLVNRLENRLQHTPKFNPKPRSPGA